MKKKQNTTPQTGIISKCIQQMINVTSNYIPKKNNLKTTNETKKSQYFQKNQRISLTEADDYEKPRDFIPVPQNHEKSLNTYFSRNNKKNSESDTNASELMILEEKFKKARIESLYLKENGLKNKKELEYSIILEDFKFRLVQKIFFVVLKQGVFIRKQRKTDINVFEKKIKIKTLRCVFEVMRNVRLKHKRNKELLESIQACIKHKTQSIYMRKWIRWFRKKADLSDRRQNLMEMSCFYSIKNYLKKMNNNRIFSKNYRLFIKSKLIRLQRICFQALKPEKLSKSIIKSKLSSLHFHDNDNIIPNFSKLRSYLLKQLAKKMKELKNCKNNLLKNAKIKEKFIISKGKINLSEVNKILQEKKALELKRKAWISLKIFHFNQKKELLSVKYREMKLKNRLIQSLKFMHKMKNYNSIQKTRLIQIFRDLTLKPIFFRYMKNKLLAKKTRTKAYLLAKSFSLLKKYYKYRKNKSDCLNSISNAYFQKFKAKILRRWLKTTQNLKTINCLYKTNLRKRYLTKLLEIFRKRKLLKKYLVFLKEEDKDQALEISSFNLLKEF